MLNLSVIVPFFNEEKFLEQSVNRLLENNIYEKILLIDNNSTDGSYNIAQKLVDSNENIELHKTDKRKGKGAALSQAKDLITTSHIVIHDADLEYFPEDISEMFEMSKNFPKTLKHNDLPLPLQLGQNYFSSIPQKDVCLQLLLLLFY